ncbi:hypothetical protein EJB05_19055, partial [Eragrostis curvula]
MRVSRVASLLFFDWRTAEPTTSTRTNGPNHGSRLSWSYLYPPTRPNQGQIDRTYEERERERTMNCSEASDFAQSLIRQHEYEVTQLYGTTLTFNGTSTLPFHRMIEDASSKYMEAKK